MAEEKEVEAARAQIERSRADLAATADDLHDRLSPRQAASRQAAKASSRARQLVSTARGVIGVPGDSMQQAASRVGDTVGGFGGKVTGGLGQAPERLKLTAGGNPIAGGIVAFGLGLLAASALPASSTEREAVSSISSQRAPVKEHLQQAAHELGGAVRESAQEAAQQVQGAASDATQELAQQSKAAVTEVAEEGRSVAKDIRQQA